MFEYMATPTRAATTATFGFDASGKPTSVPVSAERRRASLIRRLHENFFKGTIAISTFGASITFQVVIQQIDGSLNYSPHHTFERKTARTFLAIAWVLFILALGISSLAAINLAFEHATRDDDEKLEGDGKRRSKMRDNETISTMMSGLLLFVMMSAFCFCSLAVTSYCEGVGWVGVGLSGIFLLVAFMAWVTHLRKKVNPRDSLFPMDLQGHHLIHGASFHDPEMGYTPPTPSQHWPLPLSRGDTHKAHRYQEIDITDAMKRHLAEDVEEDKPSSRERYLYQPPPTKAQGALHQ